MTEIKEKHSRVVTSEKRFMDVSKSEVASQQNAREKEVPEPNKQVTSMPKLCITPSEMPLSQRMALQFERPG